MTGSRHSYLLPIIVCGVLIVGLFPLYSNSARDIGEEPKLSEKKILSWVFFYTNIERVKRNMTPLAYDSTLEKAAHWQSDYCRSIGKLDHYSTVKGMYNPQERVAHFGGNLKTGGENVIVVFTSNISNRPFYLKNDEKGTYKDYGLFTVYWYNERQIAMEMVKSWMQSQNHRENILRSMFNSMGAGTVEGIYSGEKSYYAGQVFSGERPIDFGALTITVSGNEYGLNFPGDFDIRVVSIKEDGDIIALPCEKTGNSWLFKKQQSSDKQLYVCIYDDKADILYPIKML
jgi:uncharacterized protein YkwD